MSNVQHCISIDPIQAIKAAVQATQEANKAGGKHNTEILNAVAKKLGFKDYRALQHCATSNKPATVVSAPLDFKPFTLVQEAYDETVDRVSLEINVKMAKRLLELGDGAVCLKAAVPYPDWKEESVDRRTNLSVRPILGKDGSVCLQGEIADKHSSSPVCVQGEIDLKQMLDFVSGDAQHTDSLDPEKGFLWKADTRELFLFSDLGSSLVESLAPKSE